MKTHPVKESGVEEHYSVKNCHLELQVKDVDTSGRVVCFIGNTYNFFDNGADILLPGAAAKSILENGPNSNAPDKIQHAMFHDLTRIPGKFQKVEEITVEGKQVLYAESKLSKTTEGNDALINYLDKVYNQHSIGFQKIKYDYISNTSHGNSKESEAWKTLVGDCINADELEDFGMARVLKEIKLFEISTVSFGMNKLTASLGVKSENKDVVMLNYMSRIDKLQQQLKSGTQSDGSMRSFEIQILQIKQMIQDIFEQFGEKQIKPIEKTTGFDYDKLLAAMG